MQSLLGAFYYIEAAVLMEDFHDDLHHTHGYMDVYYYQSSEITSAYHTAA